MDVSTAILDVGSHTIKAGLGTASAPEFIPSIAGVHKYRALFPTRPASVGPAGSSLFVGREVTSRRGLLKLSYPIRHGTVTDWPAMVALLRQAQRQVIHPLRYDASDTRLTSSSLPSTTAAAGVYTSSSSSSSPSEATAAAMAPTVSLTQQPSVYALVESPFTSRVQRRRLIELILERGSLAGDGDGECDADADALRVGDDAQRHVSAGRHAPPSRARARNRDDYGGNEVTHLFCGVSPLLALYSTGQVTGVCIDVGEGVVSTAAAVNGFALTRVMQRVHGAGPTGGSVTAYLQTLLPQSAGGLRRGGGGAAAAAAHSDTSCLPEAGAEERGVVAAWAATTPWQARSAQASPMHTENNQPCHVRESETMQAHTRSEMMSVLCAGGHVATELVRGIKESCGRVAAQAGVLSSTAAQTPNDVLHVQRYGLPDGSEMTIGAEATEASEVLFEPSLIGSDSPGVADLVMQTVRLSDMDLRPQLLSHVLVCGGSTLLAGFGLRMLNELLARTPRDNRVRVVAPAERGYAAWLGAAFLSQLSTFMSDMVVTRAEYEEHGESIVHVRMFK